MNHAGEIRPLTQMIQPHVAIITSIEEAHAEFFASIEDIARAKAEIFEGMSAGGSVVLNRDNLYFGLLSSLAQIHSLNVYGFGRSEKADFRLLSWENKPDTSKVTAQVGGKVLSYILPLPGLHWVLNSLAVLGAAYLAGANMEQAITSLAIIEAPQGRGKRYPGPFTVLDESYNANPASMRAALAVLGQSEADRKIAVLGDMREMGVHARAHHEALLEPLLENGIEKVFCCGPLMAHLYERLPNSMQGGYAPTSLELIPLVLKAIKAVDTISVKASLGTRAKPIVDALLDQQKKMGGA
jgi:UDP-N-acetylmuramoyl-tripeptide--D-alanyl-D-alanine ligase